MFYFNELVEHVNEKKPARESPAREQVCSNRAECSKDLSSAQNGP
jgi:hypothetical protein